MWGGERVLIQRLVTIVCYVPVNGANGITEIESGKECVDIWINSIQGKKNLLGDMNRLVETKWVWKMLLDNLESQNWIRMVTVNEHLLRNRSISFK